MSNSSESENIQDHERCRSTEVKEMDCLSKMRPGSIRTMQAMQEKVVYLMRKDMSYSLNS